MRYASSGGPAWPTGSAGPFQAEPEELEREPWEVSYAMTTPPSWATCPVCRRERRVCNGVMSYHRLYDRDAQRMVDCPGTGQEPASTGLGSF
jgi:hypothetical protein